MCQVTLVPSFWGVGGQNTVESQSLLDSNPSLLESQGGNSCVIQAFGKQKAQRLAVAPLCAFGSLSVSRNATHSVD